MTVRVGTSGWVYPHWRGLFYPQDLRQDDWLAYYASHFDTVEIINSFYRLPSEAAFDAWRKQAPAGFIFSVKASRYLTHMKKLKDPEAPLGNLFDRARHLRKKLGPVLYQLPPCWRLNLERFEQFLKALPARRSHVVEFRQASWLAEPVFELMAQHGVAHCIHDMRQMEVPQRVTASPAYLRLHGAAGNEGNYSKRELKRWAERVADWAGQGADVYVYFNNDWQGHAIKNAQTLREML
jgi:uncharacterized protein YecE (DUF72 family)